MTTGGSAPTRTAPPQPEGVRIHPTEGGQLSRGADMLEAILDWAWDRPDLAWLAETTVIPGNRWTCTVGRVSAPGPSRLPIVVARVQVTHAHDRGDLASLTGVVEHDVLAELAAALHRRAVVAPGRSTLLFLVPSEREPPPAGEDAGESNEQQGVSLRVACRLLLVFVQLGSARPVGSRR